MGGGGGCCASGVEPMRSVQVKNFLISSETLSSVLHAVTNLDVMKCVFEIAVHM